jgi:hypothetical protein
MAKQNLRYCVFISLDIYQFASLVVIAQPTAPTQDDVNTLFKIPTQYEVYQLQGFVLLKRNLDFLVNALLHGKTTIHDGF